LSGRRPRRVHRVARHLAIDDREHLPRDIDRDVLLRLDRGAGDVRGEDRVRCGADARVGGDRLGREHVERGAADRPCFERVRERVEVDDLAARAVHEDRGRPHLRERGRADEPAGLVGERCVQRDDVGLGEQPVELDELGAERASETLRRERVVRDDLHLERRGAPSDEATDAPDADEAERLAPELAAHELAAGPLTAPDARVRGHDVAHEGECQRERVLRGCVDVARRGVHDVHAARGGCGHVDVVDADAGAPDDLQLRCVIEQRRRHLRLAAHEQRDRRAEAGLQLLRPLRGQDVAALAEQRQPLGGQRVRDDDDGSGSVSGGRRRHRRARGERYRAPSAPAARRSRRTRGGPLRSPGPARPVG